MTKNSHTESIERVSKALENFYGINDEMTLEKAKTIIQSVENDLIKLYPDA